MHVYVSKNVQSNARVHSLQKKISKIVAHEDYRAQLLNKRFELAAEIVPGSTADELLVDFIFKPVDEEDVQVSIGGDDKGRPIPVDVIVKPDSEQLDDALVATLHSQILKVGRAYARQRTPDVED